MIGRLAKAIYTAGLENTVRLVGAVEHTKVIEFIKMADLFVLPSWTEGLPNVVLEAAAAALPIVATEVGGIPEIIEGNGDGRLVPARQVRPLFEAVADALRHPQQSRQWGLKARERMCGIFNYEDNKC